VMREVRRNIVHDPAEINAMLVRDSNAQGGLPSIKGY
jgi:hypothetical protein